MGILDKNLIITMQSGESWSIPVTFIADNRANHFKFENHDNDFTKSRQATMEFFEEGKSNIKHWAKTIPWDEITRLGTQIKGTHYDYIDVQDAKVEIQ